MGENRGVRIAALLCAGACVCAAAPDLGPAVAAPGGDVVLRPSCQSGFFGLGGEPRRLAELPGAPEPALLGSFAVLRRGAVPSDQPPPLNSLAEEFASQLAGYYPSEVRRLIALPDGRSFYLVVGLPRPASIPPARCLPRSLRAKRKRIVEEDARRAREPVYCIGEARPVTSGSGGGACLPFAEIASGGALSALPFTSSGVTADLVPDGIATVRVGFRDGTAVSCLVSENAYLLSPPAALLRHIKKLAASARSTLTAGARRHLSPRERRQYVQRFVTAVSKIVMLATPTAIEWLSPEGVVVRTITPAGPLRRRSTLLSTG